MDNGNQANGDLPNINIANQQNIANIQNQNNINVQQVLMEIENTILDIEQSFNKPYTLNK